MKVGITFEQYDENSLEHNQGYTAFDEDWESKENKRNMEFDWARSILSLDKDFKRRRNQVNFRK
jgi:hypothetical protein